MDFVVEKDGKIIPIEVKSDLIKPKSTKSFLSFINKYKPGKKLILSEKLFKDEKRISFRPIFSITKEI